jgi:hypothetical protein
MEDFKVEQGPRAVGGPVETSAEEWIGFLTEEGRYDKTIRTKEEARALGKPTVLYPDPTDIHKFYAFGRDKDMIIPIEYKNNFLNELNPGGFVSEQIIFLSELKKALGLPTQRGGLRSGLHSGLRGGRRRSHKAKKARSPQ